MSNGKVKVYKNPARNVSETYKPYVPQYQVRGIEPEEHKSSQSSILGMGVKPNPLPLDNPRAPKSAIRQPYAEATSSPVGRGRGPVPNVGNNMEHTWSSVNEEIVDDLTGGSALDPNHEMVDNNDYVSASALGLSEELPALDEVAHPVAKQFTPKNFLSQAELANVMKTEESRDDLFGIVEDLEEGTYLLIVNGVAVCSGPADEIQDQARALVFGEHELCDGEPIPAEDLVILKRATVKVGLFLE
jgi:hypothetical protein